MNKLLIICGPTATGKTSLGIELAKKINGEIVSADSRQVYRGMDIGTGKDTKCTMYNVQFKIKDFKIGYYLVDEVKVWLLDIVEPDYKFNVADYKKCADAALEDIWKRGKLPIIVGGTGFYIKAVVDGIGTMGVEPDWKLRNKLSNCQIDELQMNLKKLDPKKWVAMNESDRQNPRRLIRAIEIAQWSRHSGDPPAGGDSRILMLDTASMTTILKPLFIGLTAPFQTLYQRIDQRVGERVKDRLEDEICGLLNKGYSWDNSVLGTTLAYSEWKEYFEVSRVSNVPRVSRGNVIQKWKFDEHNYARRQMTWFKKDKRVNWFDISEKVYKEKVEKLVENWYIREDA